ncbi:G1 family glutamic endopeptidase [Streptomyces anandii]|uniref:G1 family glutamic endopeptidase n=1 Tax=Streptomyces anandii TaxID=285454 RepID=UPI0036F5DD78
MHRVYRYTVTPGLNSGITIRTLPNAICSVCASDNGAPALLAHSDSDGFLVLDVASTAESAGIARLVIEALTDGSSIEHLLELHLDKRPTDKAPSPLAGPRTVPKPGERIRPGLTLEESLRLGDEELLKRGYPPRPDPELNPSAFDSWYRLASTPAAFVKPYSASQLDATGTPQPRGGIESTANWSGFQASGRPGTYVGVGGQWQVPHVSGPRPLGEWYAAFWVGLDTGVLVQAGTSQRVFTTLSPSGGYVRVSNCYGWTQFKPMQPTGVEVTNFPVNAGDVVECDVWMSDNPDYGVLTPKLDGTHAVFVLTNLTTGKWTRVMTPRGSTVVRGAQAEWIAERPTVGGGLSRLADYGTVTMRAGASRVGGSYVSYYDTNPNWITMTRTGDDNDSVLSSVHPVDKNTMQFTWKGES